MKKKDVIIGIFLKVIAIVFAILVCTYDVQKIGVNGTKVGFASINDWFRNIIGSNMTIYKVTEYLGYIALAVVLVYALIGLYQLIKRKSLFKIDKEFYLLAMFYVTVLILYVLFDKFIINYRPVLIDGVLEPSFPSSHTMLALCVCGSGIIMNNKLFSKVKNIKLVNICLMILMIAILVGRTISGVHWLTDIIGGVLISAALLKTFENTIKVIKNKTIK